MRLGAIAFCAAALMLVADAAFAQQETVKTLLAHGFAVVGSIPSKIGVGVFLQNKEKLYLCFASETPTSATVATTYCKPVE